MTRSLTLDTMLEIRAQKYVMKWGK